MATEWTNFTTDLILESVNDYFYTFPLALIAVLVLTILIGWRLMKARKEYDIDYDPEVVIMNWLLTAFNSTGFWIVGLQLYQVVREEGFTYAVCNNLMTADRPLVHSMHGPYCMCSPGFFLHASLLLLVYLRRKLLLNCSFFLFLLVLFCMAGMA